MAIFIKDEFNNESIEAFWGVSVTGDATITERQQEDIYMTITDGDWGGINQQGLQDAFLDIWTRIEIPDQTFPSQCDAQFWIEDAVEYEGIIACSLAYHTPIPAANTIITGGGGLGFYVWAWKSSNGWASEQYHYIKIDQPYIYSRIRAQVNGICRVYYALEEPKWDTDWIEVSLPNPIEYLPTNLDAVYMTAGSITGWGEEEHAASFGFVRKWSEPPTTKVRSKNINFSKTAPTVVEEMKDGEWRLTDNGLYARVGNQILTKGWPDWTQIYDEFNDGVLDAKWTEDPQGSSTGQEIDGNLKATHTGEAASRYMGWYQDPTAGDGGLTPVPVGMPITMAMRCYIPPTPYDASVTELSWDLHNYHGMEIGIWDDNITWECLFAWCYGGTIKGTNMNGREPCFMARVDVDDEINVGITEYFGSPEMKYTGEVDHVIDFADQNHNGWFTLRFSKAGDGTFTFDIQPDGDDNWYSLTPPGLSKYNLQIGGKSAYGWGFELYSREINQGGYDDIGTSYGPYYMDWLRPSTLEGSSITFTTTTTTTT